MLSLKIDYDVQLEGEVLGRLLKEGELLKVTNLFEECFSEGYHRELFKTMRKMEKENVPINTGTMYSYLLQDIDSVGGIKYIESLEDQVATVADFDFHEKTLLTQFKHIQSNKIFQALNDKEITFAEAGIRLTALEDFDSNSDDGDINKFIDEATTDLYTENKGVKTKFDGYDELTKGLHAEELVVIGARPSVGKTAFVLNLANNIVRSETNKDGCTVALFSLEMGGKQNVNRLQSMNSQVPLAKVHDAINTFTDEEYKKANFALQYLRSTSTKIYDDSGVTVFDIWSKVKKLRLTYGENEKIVVIIDYLQLISSKNSNKNRNDQVGEISRTLKIMARELKVCVIALSQLNRGVESRQEKRPVMADLKESGSIEQDADVIGLLYRDDYYDRETQLKNIIELIVCKNRNGAVGTVQLHFNKEIGKVKNIATNGGNGR